MVLITPYFVISSSPYSFSNFSIGSFADNTNWYANYKLLIMVPRSILPHMWPLFQRQSNANSKACSCLTNPPFFHILKIAFIEQIPKATKIATNKLNRIWSHFTAGWNNRQGEQSISFFCLFQKRGRRHVLISHEKWY